MATSRAQEVAEVLWELKRADKVARFSEIAGRAGFSAGTNGRTMTTCLKTIRRDWPHLQWWRAIKDDGVVEKDSEHESKLRELGFDFEAGDGKNADKLVVSGIEERLMEWEDGDEE